MRIFRKIKDKLTIIFNGNYYLMNNPFDKKWDSELKTLMKNHRFTDIGEHTAKLGDNLIWIANYPYSTFHRYEYTITKRVRASRMTIIEAKRKLDADRKFQSEISSNKNKVMTRDLSEQLEEYIYDFTDNGFKYELEIASLTYLKLNINLIDFKIDEITTMKDYLTLIDRLKDKYNIVGHNFYLDSKFAKIVITISSGNNSSKLKYDPLPINM